MPLEEVEGGSAPAALPPVTGMLPVCKAANSYRSAQPLSLPGVDGGGKPLDGPPAPDTPLETGALITPPFNPLRTTPNDVLDTGVRAINALLTVGRGQRMDSFAGSGVGKSVLLCMMALHAGGRDCRDYRRTYAVGAILSKIFPAPDGRARSVVIAAPA